MRVRTISRTELAGAYGCPAAFGVVPSTGMGTCAGSENGIFACLDCSVGGKEDELETFDCGCHDGIGFGLVTAETMGC